MKAGKRWRLSLLGSGESLTDSIGLYSREVHAESIERHRDGRIGLANTGPSPSCSVKSPELLSYTSGASELQFWVPPAEGSRGLDGHWWGNRDRSDAPALKVHEIQNLFSSTSNIHSSLLGSYK